MISLMPFSHNGESRRYRFAALSFLFCFLILTGAASAGPTMDRVRDDGVLRCGLTLTGKGLTTRDATGQWRGFFPDFCRVVAAAVIGDAEAVEFYQVDVVSRFDALKNGDIDILMANTTWTAQRDGEQGLAFPAIYYYDGTGFMALQSVGAVQISDIAKATVCVGKNTTTIENVQELINNGNKGLTIKALNSLETQLEAFYLKKCDLIAYDRLGLIAHQARFDGPGDPPIVFPDVISKEPLAPAVRDNDMAWFDAVRWAIHATIIAEELALSSQNIEHRRDSKSTEIRRFIGQKDQIGHGLGLPDDWAFQIVRQVGNYREIFERNLSHTLSPAGGRGLNRLWSEGGLLFAPPIR
ncbi:amino acid ABC transporter substrate-binding protein [Aestuariispira insulae]|uniref:General L-amino acid transport system substrate-binding protein n=1 Tax=Aestuariispira insulae TaxID=1461337 RepID=A0A3D9H6F3_9PROT|nr:amino acid ABC transporter substrate-binding protein [Aestuariispira insulae]RED45064.1 general L-amino acid transport system substrate-binding protein [Aestuariispira insulae]